MESDFLATMFPFFPAVFPAMDPTIPYEAPWQPLQSIFILAGSLDWALGLIFPLALLQQYSQWKVSGGHSEIPHRDDWTTYRPDRTSGAIKSVFGANSFEVVSALIEWAVDHKWWA